MHYVIFVWSNEQSCKNSFFYQKQIGIFLRNLTLNFDKKKKKNIMFIKTKNLYEEHDSNMYLY